MTVALFHWCYLPRKGIDFDAVSYSLFLTLIAAQDELKFDTHTGASPDSIGR